MAFDVFGWVNGALNNVLGGPGGEEDQNAAPATATTVTEEGKEEEPSNIARGRFVPEDEEGKQSSSYESMLYLEAKKHTDRFRKTVESFDEDKQSPVEWALYKAASLYCYLVPFVLAIPLGLAIGDKFSAGQPFWMVNAMHILSIALEIAVPLMGLATNVSFKRACKDRGEVAMFIVVATFYLGISILNAFALLLLLETAGFEHLKGAAMIAMYGRSFGPLINDIACTAFLAVATVKSLKKYLADQRAKIIAVRDVNAVNIELEKANIDAAIQRQTAMQDMKSKQQRADTWNEIEQIQAQTMIQNAKQNMLNSGDGGSNYRRRLY